MAKKFISIDLQQKQKTGSVDKFIDWALSIGRLLVIITELIAVGAFLYRFTLDKQLIDLNSKIKSEQAIVQSFQTKENSYRNLQARLALASSTISMTDKRTKIFEDIVGFAPVGLTFNTVAIYPDSIQIDADASSVIPLSVFVNALKTYPAIDTVSINQIENKVNNATINITITATLKKEDSINATN